MFGHWAHQVNKAPKQDVAQGLDSSWSDQHMQEFSPRDWSLLKKSRLFLNQKEVAQKEKDIPGETDEMKTYSLGINAEK